MPWRNRHIPRLCRSCGAPMAGGSDTCWQCGAPWTELGASDPPPAASPSLDPALRVVDGAG